LPLLALVPDVCPNKGDQSGALERTQFDLQ
jgi:hypothetical protein